MTYNAFGDGGLGVSSKLSVCILYFILAVISGGALKHYSVGRWTLAGYGLYFAHSVLCFLRHTHPNPGNVQRTICEKSRRYAPVCFITLLIGELVNLNGDIQLCLGMDWRVISLVLYASIVLMSVSKRFISTKSFFVDAQRMCLNLCVVWNCYCLLHIALTEQFYWALGLAFQVLLNHFVLWRLALHFNISQLEIGTVGMCFSVIFAINSTQELLEELNNR